MHWCTKWSFKLEIAKGNLSWETILLRMWKGPATCASLHLSFFYFLSITIVTTWADVYTWFGFRSNLWIWNKMTELCTTIVLYLLDSLIYRVCVPTLSWTLRSFRMTNTPLDKTSVAKPPKNLNFNRCCVQIYQTRTSILATRSCALAVPARTHCCLQKAFPPQ